METYGQRTIYKYERGKHLWVNKVFCSYSSLQLSTYARTRRHTHTYDIVYRTTQHILPMDRLVFNIFHCSTFSKNKGTIHISTLAPVIQ